MEVSKKKFDVADVVTAVLSYLQYGRIMLAMACFGILAGMCYYVYATPVYSTKSVVYYRIHGAPVSDRGVAETSIAARSVRNLPRQLASQRNILAAAKRAGVVGPVASFEDVKRQNLKVIVSVVDASHLEVSVDSRSPKVARVFCQMLIDEFLSQQQEAWKKFRENAMNRYAEEVRALEEQARVSLKGLTQLEKDGKMAETAFERSRLSMIPSDLVVAKEVLRRMGEVNEKLSDLRKTQPERVSVDEVFQELSLLTAFEKEREVRVGDLVRREDKTKGPLLESDPKARIVVQPGMVEGLKPWQELEKERRSLEDKIVQASKTYLPDHEIPRSLAEQLETNEQGLRAELSVMRQRFDLDVVHYQDKVKELEAQLPSYYALNEQIGLATQEYSSMERGKGMWEKARDILADRLAVVSFSEDLDWTELRFKEYVSLRDEDPVSPSKIKLMLISIWLAIGGAIGVPTLLKFANSSVSTLNQLESATGLTAIAITPHASKNVLENIAREPSLGSKTPNYLLESFRLIRSHILLHPNPKGLSQVVLVTSARPSEGKTTQAANLAWAFQSMGSRTLLIDCDMRRGRQHEVFDISNEAGLSALMMERCTLSDAIQKTANPLLDVMPRGATVAGVTEFLSQQNFTSLIAHLRKEYDQIVLDSPPILGLSEAMSLQRVADGVMLVVRAEQTTKKDLSDAVNMVRKTGAHVYGMVLNGLDMSKMGNYFNYYYYSANYYERVDVDAAQARV